MTCGTSMWSRIIWKRGKMPEAESSRVSGPATAGLAVSGVMLLAGLLFAAVIRYAWRE